MSQLFKCSACAEAVSFASRNQAAEADWLFVELFTKAKIKYLWFCGDCRPAWLKAAFGEDVPRRKEKKT